MAQLFCTGPVHIFVGSNVIIKTKQVLKYIPDDADLTEEQKLQLQIIKGKDYLPEIVTEKSFSPEYLGTAEKAPQIILRPNYRDIFTDTGGVSTPVGSIYDGCDALGSAVLTRWNEQVFQRVASFAGFSDGVPGTDADTALGTIMEAERETFVLYFVFPYAPRAGVVQNAPLPAANLGNGGAKKLAKVQQKLPGGYRFFSAKITGPIGIMPGSSAMRKQLVFGASRHWGGANPLSDRALPKDIKMRGSILYDYDVSATFQVPLN